MRVVYAIFLAVAVVLLACGSDSKKSSSTPTPAALVNADQSDGNAPGLPVLEGEIQKTASGLRYIDEKSGDGPTPSAGQTVSVQYTGWLTNGRQFDTSSSRGAPYTFVLGQGNVIKGWDEAIAAMKLHGKRRLIIPPALAYGGQSVGSVIPANATLIFDVELVGIK